MRSNKIYFISGVCGVGKTSTLLHLKKILSGDLYDVRDFDERGVPDGGGQIWHDGETKHWLKIAAANAKNGKSTVITGFTNPDQFKTVYDIDKNIPAQIILLNASGNTIRTRLYGRYPTPESMQEIHRASGISLDAFVENNTSFAPTLRTIFERNGFPIIETDDRTSEEVAQEVVKIIT